MSVESIALLLAFERVPDHATSPASLYTRISYVVFGESPFTTKLVFVEVPQLRQAPPIVRR